MVKLRTLNLDPVFLTSERTSMNKLQNITGNEVDKVKVLPKKGFRHLLKKNRRCPPSIPEQGRIRSLCKCFRYLEVGEDALSIRLLDTDISLTVLKKKTA